MDEVTENDVTAAVMLMPELNDTVPLSVAMLTPPPEPAIVLAAPVKL